MTAIVGKAGLIHDVLPGGIHVACERSWPEPRNSGIESGLCDIRHSSVLVPHCAELDEPPERRMIARDAGREFEKDRFAGPVPSYTPSRVLLAEPAARPNERSEARRMPPGPRHGREAGGRNLAFAGAVRNRIDRRECGDIGDGGRPP